MSFNHHDTDPNIHLGNYEAFFLLYMDGELSPEGMNAVEAFLQQHPDLQGEFDLLLTTKLDGEVVSINKESLLASSMQAHEAEEQLLLYIDNELTPAVKSSVEKEIGRNALYKKHYQALVRAKLDPAEMVLHPRKEELYRRAGRVVGMAFWIRIAAVLLVLLSAVVLFLGGEKEGAPLPSVAQDREKKPVENKISPPVILPVEDEVNEQALAAQQADVKPAEEKKEIQPVKVYEEREEVLPPANQLAALMPDEIPAAREKMILPTRLEERAVSKEIFNKGTVTKDLALRTTVYATPEAEAATEVAQRKGSLKGFLRKATRLIERTTGIDATNGDDELLISAVAIKLK